MAILYDIVPKPKSPTRAVVVHPMGRCSLVYSFVYSHEIAANQLFY
jgi:hypothetical protein